MAAASLSGSGPPNKGLAFKELFDPEFLEALHLLRLRARQVAPGGRYAEQKSRDLGHGMEFRDFRPYSPGDDLRSIDWNIYRRLGKVFVKLFEEQQDLPLYLMPDVSASMFMEDKPRIHAALRVALALASISLGQHDSVGLFPFADDLQIKVKSKSGKASVMSFARHLAELEPRDQTRLSNSIRRFSGMKIRRGLLVIISDFFDPDGIEAVIAALKPVRHRLLLIQLARKSDGAPDLQGDVRLRDCETGEISDITVTPAVLKRYREAYAAFNDQLDALAKSRQAALLRLDVEEDLVAQLSTLFQSGTAGAGSLLV